MKRFLKENRGIILFLVLMAVFRSSIADWNPVPTGSMLPTIVEGDVILVNKLAYDVRLPFSQQSIYQLNTPERGDIVVFKSKAADLRMVKRVIGLPGDTITMLNNQLFINGQSVDYEKQAEDSQRLVLSEKLPGKTHALQLLKRPSPADNLRPFTVPADHYFVMGDNRRNSSDSRVYGFIPHSEIVGRANNVIVSFDFNDFYLPRAQRWFKTLQ